MTWEQDCEDDESDWEDEDDESFLIKLYVRRKRLRQRILATHPCLPRPNLSPEACAQRAPLWRYLDALNSRIRQCNREALG